MNPDRKFSQMNLPLLPGLTSNEVERIAERLVNAALKPGHRHVSYGDAYHDACLRLVEWSTEESNGAGLFPLWRVRPAATIVQALLSYSAERVTVAIALHAAIGSGL